MYCIWCKHAFCFAACIDRSPNIFQLVYILRRQSIVELQRTYLFVDFPRVRKIQHILHWIYFPFFRGVFFFYLFLNRIGSFVCPPACLQPNKVEIWNSVDMLLRQDIFCFAYFSLLPRLFWFFHFSREIVCSAVKFANEINVIENIA